MLQCSTSLWSADLANLENEIKRVEPYSGRFHIDVADGHYSETLLFFPDLVKQIRPHTDRPFEVHLMTTDPELWLEPFIDAGSNVIIFHLETVKDPNKMIDTIHAKGNQAGIVLTLDQEIDLLEPYWEKLDMITLVSTQIGIKGADMDPAVPNRIRQARETIARNNLSTLIQVDGAIRRHTVPLYHEAGADWIVPGSMMFNEDPDEIQAWLKTL
jgi:ribulose-phosphate 3-epimerase